MAQNELDVNSPLQRQEIASENEISCVTQECACGCGLPRRNKSKYAHPTHRDRLRNKGRIIAYQKLLEV